MSATVTTSLTAGRLRPADVLRVGAVGLRSRPLRTSLTALGIAIGIAAMVAVVGISSSSRADLISEIDALGTDMLRAAPGRDMFGDQATLPSTARATAARVGPVTSAAGLTYVDATVRRSPYVDDAITSGVVVAAADTNVLDAVSGELAQGHFVDDAASAAPTVVLGSNAARRLGIRSLAGHPMVWIQSGDTGQWFAVAGILEPTPLAPELNDSALVGYGVVADLWGIERSPSLLFVRTTPDSVDAVRGVLARSIDPEHPNQVDISRPSDALEARARTDTALRNLLLGLGAVALIVGGVGITNVMVISVLERRGEIGVRRALGAKRRHIAIQFLTEAALLSALGGLLGSAAGAGVTAIYARARGWRLDVPIDALAAGTMVALAVGLLAGVSPSVRAARLDPAEAIRPA